MCSWTVHYLCEAIIVCPDADCMLSSYTTCLTLVLQNKVPRKCPDQFNANGYNIIEIESLTEMSHSIQIMILLLQIN